MQRIHHFQQMPAGVNRLILAAGNEISLLNISLFSLAYVYLFMREPSSYTRSDL